jgi:outer membrane receptor protein involved in Fe transport
MEYGSGLPFDFTGTYDQALAEYGQQMASRINFSEGRIKPTFSVDISAGAELYRKETRSLRLQADAENLNNRLNVLDFAALFSGTAIAPPRSYFLRLGATF